MGIFYKAGENKIRPGVYQRYTSSGTPVNTSARNGIAAIAIQANWGAVGVVTEHSRISSIQSTYGADAYTSTCTVEAAKALIEGGAEKVYIVRMGTGGTKASLKLKGGTGGNTDLATVTAKHPGTKEIAVSVQEKLGDSTKKVFTVYAGNSEVESFTFDANSTDETENLIKAAADSAYVDISASTTGEFAAVTATAGKLTGGVNPTVTNESYTAAWEALEAYSYNVIALDVTDDSSLTLSMLLQEYIKSAYTTGKLCMGVVGEPTTVSFANRCAHARSFNDEKIVFFGSGFKNANGDDVNGALAICRAAGAIAATPSNQSIVHLQLPGAADTVEKLTNEQYETAITSGLLLLSTGADGQVWFDSGINTLVTPGEAQDEGWKKIRRVKTRFEIMDRADRVVAPKIGRINCNADGIAEVIQSVNGILAAMVAESKLLAGAVCYEDEENPPTADSAWFIIDAVDYDSLEKIYLHYQFKYSQNS